MKSVRSLVGGVEGGKGSLALGRGVAEAVVALMLVFSSIGAWAQATPDVEQGMRPYGSYEGGNLDHISLTNGNLFFHADLLAYSQRGGELSRPVVLQYNGKDFSLFQPPCPSGTKLGTTQCPFRAWMVFNANPMASNTTRASHGNSVTIAYEGLPFTSIYAHSRSLYRP